MNLSAEEPDMTWADYKTLMLDGGIRWVRMLNMQVGSKGLGQRSPWVWEMIAFTLIKWLNQKQLHREWVMDYWCTKWSKA